VLLNIFTMLLRTVVSKSSRGGHENLDTTKHKY
jgi:hypothetical protein